MFKYIKKLISVVVMFAIIIVFSTSKVYAGTVSGAFSMPPNVEKAAEVVGIVNDIATLTGLGLKSRQDVDVDKVKAKKRKVLNMITVIAVDHFFSSKDSKKLETIMIASLIATQNALIDIKKNKELKKSEPYTDANKISPLNVLNNGFVGVSPELEVAGTGTTGTLEVAGTGTLEVAGTGTTGTLEVAGTGTLEVKMDNGKFYEVASVVGGFELTDNGKAKLANDNKAEAKAKAAGGNNDGGGDGGHH